MLRTLFIIIILTFSFGLAASPNWHWEDRFSRNEKEHLQQWILHAEKGMITLFGSLPYTYRVHFHRMTRGRGPTPWANTDKRNGRAVHFHVNTAYAWDLFRKDWTAPHELSHLMFPYMGTGGKWFSEGLASYLQYQVMYANETITWKQATNKLEERFSAASSDRGYENISIVDLGNIVSQNGAYERLYWGGAAYFMQVDRVLSEKKSIRLTDVIGMYLKCCVYRDYDSSGDMLVLFDHLSGSDIFSRVYTQTVDQNGFPATSKALTWLRENPPVLQ